MSINPRLIDERAGPVADATAQYLAELGRHELLTAQEEVELAIAMEVGVEAERLLAEGKKTPAERRALREQIAAGSRARERFIAANLRLVVSNARKYAAHANVDLLDLIQEGNLGLIRAVEKFDWRKGFKFSTYATWWIRQALQRALAQYSRTIRVPAELHDFTGVVLGAITTLYSELGREPTLDELAEKTGLEVAQVDRVLRVNATISLEEPVGEDGATVGDFVADETAADPFEAAEQILTSEALQRAIGRLPEKQAEIVTLRFGLNDGRARTFAEVAEIVGLTAERVRQLVREALETLATDLSPVAA
jgi:RNA polymerase sigma factor (sigma-70 family)